MTSTFFAIHHNDVVRWMDVAEYEVNVNTTDAYRIMQALGFEVDYRDHPAGALPTPEFLNRVEASLATTDQPDMVAYMLRLRDLAWAARRLDTIAWG